MIWTKLFWKDAAERAISTFAQAFIATISLGATGLFDVDWLAAASVAGLSALISLGKAVAATYTGDPSSASLVPGLGTYPVDTDTY